jgi:hypothetical protein
MMRDVKGEKRGGDTIEVVIRDSQYNKVFEGVACFGNAKSVNRLIDVLEKKGFKLKNVGVSLGFEDFY